MNKIIQIIKLGVIALVLIAGAQYIEAFGPGANCTPPACNTDAPLNVATTTQEKIGGLTLGQYNWINGLSDNPNTPLFTSLVVQNGRVAIGTTEPDENLKVAVVGSVGADGFCDIDGENCVDSTTWGKDAIGTCGAGKYLEGFDSSGDKICKSVPGGSSTVTYYFGGMYGYPSSAYTNPLAGNTKSCPTNYKGYIVLSQPGVDNKLIVCVGDSSTGATKVADFGGVYTVSSNPGGPGGAYSNPFAGNTYACPTGYTSKQVYGTANVDWPLMFCYRPSTTDNGTKAYGGMYGARGGGREYENAVTAMTTCPLTYNSKKIFGLENVDHGIRVCY